METTILLLRHGYIDMADRIPGRSPNVHLSQLGRIQAQNCRSLCSSYPISAIYSSPLERAVETAQPIADHLNLDIIKCQSLTEINFGQWTQMTFSDLEHDFTWKQFHFFRGGCTIPGGELMIQVQTRMILQMEVFRRKHPDQVILAVSHNDPIKSVIAYYLGISLDLFLRISIPNASLSVLSLYDNSVSVKAIGIINENNLQDIKQS